MDGRLPPRVGLLALLHGTGGLLCAIGALHPMSARTPVGLLWVLAAVGGVVAAGLLLAARRVTVAVEHVALALYSTLLAVLAACSATAVGVVGLGPVLIVVGLYAAHFLPLRAARAHTVWLVTAATTGAVLAAPSGFAMAWLVAVMTTLLLTEAHGRLSGRLRTDAATDPLTGLANRRAWQAEAERCLARAQRGGGPLTVAILDLDDFKLVNDQDGHSAGDRLLRQVAGHWRARLRTSDLLGRHGGDEFVLCLPDTDLAGAQDLLARLDGAPINWSFGTATARPGDSLSTLLQRADAELYALKRRRGRAIDPGARLGDG